MKVVFVKQHSDDSGVYAAGQIEDLDHEKAQELINKGVAKLRPPDKPTEYKKRADDDEETSDDADDEGTPV